MTKFDVSHPRSPPPATDNDDQLIQLTLQGNEKSFAQLIEKYRLPIFNLVLRHVRQREESEDVVQQVFLKAFQHLGSFRGDSKFFTWLYTIALNLVRNHVRQRNIRRTESLDVSEKDNDRPGPQWAEKQPSTEEIVHHRWELDRVKAAVLNLPEEYRVIFTLHYFQHLPLKDVAAHIGRPAPTVKVYLQRARKMVLTELEKLGEPKNVTA